MTKDAIVFVGCCFVAVFLAGLVIGQDNKPHVCPVAEGQQVVSTIDSKDAQVCVYANSYGRATQKKRAVKS